MDPTVERAPFAIEAVESFADLRLHHIRALFANRLLTLQRIGHATSHNQQMCPRASLVSRALAREKFARPGIARFTVFPKLQALLALIKATFCDSRV